MHLARRATIAVAKDITRASVHMAKEEKLRGREANRSGREVKVPRRVKEKEARALLRRVRVRALKVEPLSTAVVITAEAFTSRPNALSLVMEVREVGRDLEEEEKHRSEACAQ